MSEVAIQGALERHLAALGGVDTQYENVTFTPVPTAPFQRVNLLPLTPVDEVLGRGMVKLRGLMQVTLCYPAGGGRGPVQTRADALRAHFDPPLTLTQDGIKVQVVDTVNVGSGYADGSRWCVAVSIPYFAYVFK